MEDRNITFQKYIDEIKKAPLNFKKEILIDSLKELIAIFDQLAMEDNIKLEYVRSKEILDLNLENVSEDDYIEAALVYLEVAKDIIGQYMIVKLNL